MDDKSRKDVETMLVEGAKKWSNQQFFFISPQNSAYNNPDMRKLNGDRVVIMDLEKSGDRVNNNRWKVEISLYAKNENIFFLKRSTTLKIMLYLYKHSFVSLHILSDN